MKYIFGSLIVLLTSLNSFAASFIVEMKKPLSDKELHSLGSREGITSIEKFVAYESSYFGRVYEVSAESLAVVESLPGTINIESVYSYEAASIKPGDSSRLATGDSLFPLQWGLVSQGQEITKDISDISYVTVIEDKEDDLPPTDINWIPFYENQKTLMKKEVTVAVIDSGVDLGHPEIKESISTNMVECAEDGSIDVLSKEDKDNNGLAGDCKGWNFTENLKSPLAKFPHDDTGHGTHIAGIIAAKANHLGVMGVSDKIKILPIKVMHRDETSRESKLIAFSDRIARGVIYAIKRKVDVINLSIAWHERIETKYLRNAINEAIEQGIIVVSSAGNNATRSKILPCAYAGVLCVGATSIDGKLAEFSNYGGNVDVLAPGDHILSLFPLKMVPELYPIPGIELKSGTSQAAPFVSATAGILKSVFDGISSSEIKARIFESARPVDSDIAMHGLIDLSKALNITKKLSIKPIFKNIGDINFNMVQKKFGFKLPIYNYWEEANEVSVKLVSKHDGVTFKQMEFKIEKIPENRPYFLNIEGEISKTNSERNVPFEIIISTDGYRKSFSHEFTLTRILTGKDPLKVLPVKFAKQKKPLGRVVEKRVDSLVFEVFPKDSNHPVYFLRRNFESEKKKGVELSVFNLEGESVVESKNTIFLDKAEKLLDIRIVDMNIDGKNDILIRFVKNDQIIYSIYAMDGSELFETKFNHWKYSPEVVMLSKDAIFAPYRHQVLGPINLPIFVSVGKLPSQQNPSEDDFFSDPDLEVRQRIYGLMPSFIEDEIVLKARALDTNSKLDEFRDEFNIRWNDNVDYLGVIENEEGKLEVIVSTGFGFRTREFSFEIDNHYIGKIVEKNFGPLKLSKDFPVKVHNLNEGESDELAFVGIVDQKRVQIASSRDGEFIRSKLEVNDPFENIQSFLQVFKLGEELIYLFESNKSLIVKRHSSKNTSVLNKQVQKFDFVPGMVLSEFYMPIVLRDEKAGLVPSLYFDSSDLGTNNIHLLKIVDGTLKEELRHSYLLPPSCKSMSPTNTGNIYKLNLLCLDKDLGWHFKQVIPE